MVSGGARNAAGRCLLSLLSSLFTTFISFIISHYIYLFIIISLLIIYASLSFHYFSLSFHIYAFVYLHYFIIDYTLVSLSVRSFLFSTLLFAIWYFLWFLYWFLSYYTYHFVAIAAIYWWAALRYHAISYFLHLIFLHYDIISFISSSFISLLLHFFLPFLRHFIDIFITISFIILLITFTILLLSIGHYFHFISLHISSIYTYLLIRWYFLITLIFIIDITPSYFHYAWLYLLFSSMFSLSMHFPFFLLIDYHFFMPFTLMRFSLTLCRRDTRHSLLPLLRDFAVSRRRFAAWYCLYYALPPLYADGHCLHVYYVFGWFIYFRWCCHDAIAIIIFAIDYFIVFISFLSLMSFIFSELAWFLRLPYHTAGDWLFFIIGFRCHYAYDYALFSAPDIYFSWLLHYIFSDFYFLFIAIYAYMPLRHFHFHCLYFHFIDIYYYYLFLYLFYFIIIYYYITILLLIIVTFISIYLSLLLILSFYLFITLFIYYYIIIHIFYLRYCLFYFCHFIDIDIKSFHCFDYYLHIALFSLLHSIICQFTIVITLFQIFH